MRASFDSDKNENKSIHMLETLKKTSNSRNQSCKKKKASINNYSYLVVAFNLTAF